jgi:hypothetical protein
VDERTDAGDVVGVSLGGGHQAGLVDDRRHPGTLALGVDEVVDGLLRRHVWPSSGSAGDCDRFGCRGGVQNSAGDRTAGRHDEGGGDAGASPLG